MRFLLLFVFVFSIACSQTDKNPIEKVLASENEKIRAVMDSLVQHEVQILFTEVIQNKSGQQTFKDYEFQVNDNNYFYPFNIRPLSCDFLYIRYQIKTRPFPKY